MMELAIGFKNGLGKQLQFYLVLKFWMTTNYASDWWKKYTYLHNRSPVIFTSNFYGLDLLKQSPTDVQVARAANVVHAMLKFRRLIAREELRPILVSSSVPVCMWQYEHIFGTTRIPGTEMDSIVYYKNSKHIVVYHRGRYFKVFLYDRCQLLWPSQIENILQKIIQNGQDPAPGEKHLAAFTAGDRRLWAKARSMYFAAGVNKNSLDAIEQAAFVLVLDDTPQSIDKNRPAKLDAFGRAMLFGKGYDRWFDKSFTLIVCSNGRIGFNAEHSWADLSVMGHLWERALADDLDTGYNTDGHTKDKTDFLPPEPIRLQWDFSDACQDSIKASLDFVYDCINDVDLHIIIFNQFGKSFIKQCNISPDAFVQMALQLAYYRDAGTFCLTYEYVMTRMFHEGRTEAIRSCSKESCEFVKSMDDPGLSKEDKIKLLVTATELHKTHYYDAMTGRGVDCHLFSLYVVAKLLGCKSPFLREVVNEPLRLSTCQVPLQQEDEELAQNLNMISAGIGFGPVDDDGYGISYCCVAEDTIIFHISSKVSSLLTNSARMGSGIEKALDDLYQLFTVNTLRVTPRRRQRVNARDRAQRAANDSGPVLCQHPGCNRRFVDRRALNGHLHVHSQRR